MSSNQVTVVIPTYQRARYVSRALRYLASAGLRFPVIVADSSSTGKDQTRQAVAQAKLDCTYLEFPPEITFYRKCHEALSSASTSLAVLMADDDFVVPTALEVAAREFDDPSVSIAHGRSMLISLDLGRDIDSFSTIRGRTLRHLVAAQTSASERIAHYLRTFSHTFYSLSRREQLAEDLRLMDELKLDYEFGELLNSCRSLARGRAAVIPDLYWIKTDTLVATARTQSDMMLSWARSVTRADFSDRYGRFKQGVLAALPLNSPLREVEEAIDGAFLDFIVERVSSRRTGELARITTAVTQLRESVLRVSAITARGLRDMAKRPGKAIKGASPRTLLAGWARSLDPLSIESVLEGSEAPELTHVLDALRSYCG